MEEIIKALKALGFNTEESDSGIEATMFSIICLVAAPHKGNDFKYMVRFAPRAGFDRWANSVVIEEFFDTPEDVVTCLTTNTAEIYKRLLDDLTEQYNCLKEEFDNYLRLEYE